MFLKCDTSVEKEVYEILFFIQRKKFYFEFFDLNALLINSVLVASVITIFVTVRNYLVLSCDKKLKIMWTSFSVKLGKFVKKI